MPRRDPEWHMETTAFAMPVTGMLRPRYQRTDLIRESEIKRIYYLHIALRAAYGPLRGRHVTMNSMPGKHRGNLIMPWYEMHGGRSTGARVAVAQCRVGRCKGIERR